jgi:hypothetical protein
MDALARRLRQAHVDTFPWGSVNAEMAGLPFLVREIVEACASQKKSLLMFLSTKQRDRLVFHATC